MLRFDLFDKFDVPASRRDVCNPDNLLWAMRNLAINNRSNPELHPTLRAITVELRRFGLLDTGFICVVPASLTLQHNLTEKDDSMTMKRDAVNDLMDAVERVAVKLAVVNAIDCDPWDTNGQCKALHDPIHSAGQALETLRMTVGRMDRKTSPLNELEV